MDKNKNAEVGDCVKIFKPRARFNGCIGRVTARVWYRGHEWLEIALDAGYKTRVRLKEANNCHDINCQEIDV